ncbi:hypothetical protein WJX75_003873 [Coccomyxa subellipsoidea]|uniref:Uncharacterized protein n=1 Tax=Coccomyxa subellipsoidea TaxID=248742 RepID=A0ABR2YXY8_9CHLO
MLRRIRGGIPAFGQKPRPTAEKLTEAARCAGDSCTMGEIVKAEDSGFQWRSAFLSPESLLSAASKDVLSLPSDVVPSWNSNGTQSFEVVTALLHENQTEVMSRLALWLCPTLTDTSFTHLLMGPRGAADLEQQYTAQSLPVDTMIDYFLGSKGR